MSALLQHLLLWSCGVLLSGLGALLLARLWLRTPIPAYRVLVFALWVCVAMPILQGVAALSGDAGRIRVAELLARPFLIPGDVVTEPTVAGEGGSPVSGVEGDARPGAGTAASLLTRRGIAFSFLALWGAGVVFLAACRIRGLWRFARLVRISRPITDPGVLAVWERLVHRRRKEQGIRLLTADGLAAPACWGLRRPVILLPGDLESGRDRDALQWALRHELVHLRRGDVTTVIGQAVLTTLLWFHPVTWWLSRALDRQRELACDALVARRGGHAWSYALALVRFAEMARERATSTLGRLAPLPCTENPSRLQRRVTMLENASRSMTRRALVSGGVIAAILLGGWCLQWAAASTLGQKVEKGEEGPELVIEILPRSHEELLPEGLPILLRERQEDGVRVRQPASLDELRGWLRKIADPEGRPCKFRADGRPFPPVYAFPNGRSYWPSQKELLIRCSREQVFGWVQAVLQICTFMPGEGIEQEVQRSPLIFRIELGVLESAECIKAWLTTDDGLTAREDAPPVAEVLIRVARGFRDAPLEKRHLEIFCLGRKEPLGFVRGLIISADSATSPELRLDPAELFERIGAYYRQAHELRKDSRAKVNAWPRTPFAVVWPTIQAARAAGYEYLLYSGIPGSLVRQLESGELR